jgi:hypothetical protein
MVMVAVFMFYIVIQTLKTVNLFQLKVRSRKGGHVERGEIFPKLLGIRSVMDPIDAMPRFAKLETPDFCFMSRGEELRKSLSFSPVRTAG